MDFDRNAAVCVSCEARRRFVFGKTSKRVSVRVARSILRDGTEQMWELLLVFSKRQKNGAHATRVLLCNPDWNDPFEIAFIEADSENWDVRLGREEPIRSNRQSVT